MAVGFTDKPVSGKTEDVFGVDKYIQGLSGFIADCDTPMTVAVQGDWGSGKTSFMMLIREEIEDKVLPIWFNTWQFSQFNLGDSLPIMLVSKLTDALGVKGKIGANMKSSLRTLGSALLHVGLSLADNVSGADVSGAIEEARDKEDKDVTEVVAELKEQFQNFVNIALKERGKDKVVVFVDDLDRLQPARAVELLEVLKLFLDCDNCVFVLAIDYEVVSQGIKQKYGETIGDEKGKSFFDKIIQVPFKMPVAHYDVAKYVKNALEQMKLGVSDETPYIELIRSSIGYNPRGMKRLMNAFLLLQRIHSDEKLSEEFAKKVLFAVLCLQLSYEKIYNFVVRNSDSVGADFYDQLADAVTYQTFLEDEQVGSDGLDAKVEELFSDELRLTDNDDTSRIAAFMKSFRDVMADENDKLTSGNLQRLCAILNFSAVTASGASAQRSTSANGIIGKGARYANALDAEFAYHKIDEKMVFGGKENLPGWNGSVIEKFRLFGQEFSATKFGHMQYKALGVLYRKDEEKFMEVRKNAVQYGLKSLFYGSGEKILAVAVIDGTEIQIETKTSSHTKATDMCKVMKAMGYAPSELELYVKLAHRVSQEVAEN